MDTRNGTATNSTFDPSVQTPPAEQASIVEDFIDIFYAPSSVFARRATASFWLHLLIISALAAVFAFANRGVFEQIFDAEFSRGMAQAMEENPQLTAETMETTRSFSLRLATIFSYVGTPLLILFVSLFVWGAARVVGAKITYGMAALIMTLAWIPRLVQSLLVTVQMLLMDTAEVVSMHSVSLSPARFMDPDATQRQLLALMGRFDLFVLWTTLLIAIGIAVIGKVPRARAAVAAGIVWLIATIPMLR